LCLLLIPSFCASDPLSASTTTISSPSEESPKDPPSSIPAGKEGHPPETWLAADATFGSQNLLEEGWREINCARSAFRGMGRDEAGGSVVGIRGGDAGRVAAFIVPPSSKKLVPPGRLRTLQTLMVDSTRFLA
jgi:hypothetical protein